MARRALLLALVALASCTASPPRTTPSPPEATVVRGTSIRVSSLVSVPPAEATDTSWTFPPGTDHFDLKVYLEGRARVTIVVRVTSEPDGRIVHSDRQNQDVDGRLDVTFPRVDLPRTGDYGLLLDVTGPGVQASNRVTIRRG